MSSLTLQQFVEQVVSAIKKRTDAPAESDEYWTKEAQIAAEILILGSPLLPEHVLQLVDILIDKANGILLREASYVPPPAFDQSASTLGTDNDKKRRYEEEVLPAGFTYASFVHVPSYIAFLMAMDKNHQFTPTADKIMNQQVTSWCPKEGRTTDLETPRSCHLSRILSHELHSGHCTVVHQTPILPDNKPSSKQDVDIAVFCETTTTRDGGQVAVLVEYKPRKNFDDFEAQAACYGTDYMSVSRRSVIGVQVSGTDVTRLSVRAFGIVPWPHQQGKPRFRKCMLMEGRNEEGLSMLVSGIRGYLESYRTEPQDNFHETMLSNVTSLHKKTKIVVKGYDYRERNVQEQDKGSPTLHWFKSSSTQMRKNLRLSMDCVLSRPSSMSGTRIGLTLFR